MCSGRQARGPADSVHRQDDRYPPGDSKVNQGCLRAVGLLVGSLMLPTSLSLKCKGLRQRKVMEWSHGQLIQESLSPGCPNQAWDTSCATAEPVGPLLLSVAFAALREAPSKMQKIRNRVDESLQGGVASRSLRRKSFYHLSRVAEAAGPILGTCRVVLRCSSTKSCDFACLVLVGE